MKTKRNWNKLRENSSNILQFIFLALSHSFYLIDEINRHLTDKLNVLQNLRPFVFDCIPALSKQVSFSSQTHEDLKNRRCPQKNTVENTQTKNGP